MKKHLQDSLVIGFALFSMFFGAGNVIFPPYLGLESGPEWLVGFFSYFMADIGLALLAMFAILRQGSPDGITARIGRIPSTVLMCAIVLCIGPMLAIPRTAATTYETSLAPLVSGFSPVLFSILFFLLILLLCVQETAVVDIVGKILTPALLIGLLVLIVVGVLIPTGRVGGQPLVENVAATGVEAGYQTMDVLAAIVFGYIILKSAREKGHTTPGAQLRVVSGASLVAGIGLLVVYLGLTYLGATTARFFDITVDRTFLVVSIVRNLLGQAGIILFAVVVALACVTTAVGLVSACADYFSGLSGGRVSYRTLVCVICVFSAVVSNFGLNEIIAIASPILSVVYPPTLVLIVLALFGSRIRRDWVFRLAALGALAVSLLEVVRTYTGAELAFLDLLPLASLDFGWVLPAAVCGAVGALIPGGRAAASWRRIFIFHILEDWSYETALSRARPHRRVHGGYGCQHRLLREDRRQPASPGPCLPAGAAAGTGPCGVRRLPGGADRRPCAGGCGLHPPFRRLCGRCGPGRRGSPRRWRGHLPDRREVRDAQHLRRVGELVLHRPLRRADRAAADAVTV